MNQFLMNALAVTKMHGLDPWINGPEFGWFWNIKPDVLGGLSKLSKIYASHVETVYR